MFKTESGKPVSLPQFFAGVEHNAERALDAAADVGLQDVKQILNRPGLGRLNQRTHRVRPGEAPHRITGKLIGSARVEKPARLVRQVIVGGPEASYAPTQEWGTRQSPPHPFLRPSLQRAKERMLERLKEVLKKGQP